MRLAYLLVPGLLALSAGAADDFKPLYNGKDLSGWHVKDELNHANVWQADGEILRVRQGTKGDGGWLTTDKQYGDFVLRLEYRIPKNGNTGVGIRYPADGEPAHEGMEIQILDDADPANAKRPPEELTGGLYVEEPALHKAEKPPGEWNAMEITCRGSSLVVVTNGVKTLDLDLAKLTVLHGHHRQYKPVSERAHTGFLGLQGDRGATAEFRHILVKEL